MAPILQVENLVKVYGKKKPFTAVQGISFHLRQGEILGLLGPNGSGKTTTIQMLLGTLSMTSGSISYFGKPFPKFRSEILQSVSFASTYTSLPYILTIEENLVVYGKLYGLAKRETQRRITPLLERFGIADKLHERIASLSAGQVTRLMLVKAMFVEPRIVLLDEPTASLDPDIAMDVCDFLLDQRKARGLSILFTSHKMDEVARLCDRAIFLKQGKIIADDLPRTLARSISHFQLTLTIGDGLKRATAIAEQQGIAFQIDHRIIRLTLEESQISPFIQAVTQSGASFTNIHIEEPSLEDYFLQIAQRKR
jgi:ABC-2 type transport system ATP-binding protein